MNGSFETGRCHMVRVAGGVRGGVAWELRRSTYGTQLYLAMHITRRAQ